MLAVSRNGMNATVTQMWTHRALYSHINPKQRCSITRTLPPLYPNSHQLKFFANGQTPPNYTDLLKMHVNVQPVHRMALCHPLKEKSHMAPTNGLLSPNPAADLTVVQRWGRGPKASHISRSAFSFNCLNIQLDVKDLLLYRWAVISHGLRES